MYQSSHSTVIFNYQNFTLLGQQGNHNTLHRFYIRVLKVNPFLKVLPSQSRRKLFVLPTHLFVLIAAPLKRLEIGEFSVVIDSTPGNGNHGTAGII